MTGREKQHCSIGEKRMPYTMYSQRDDRWQRVMLGESSTTIGANGCLICSVASGLIDTGVDIGGLPPDPSHLNRWLARNRGYVAPGGQPKERNLFVFDGLSALGVEMVAYVDARNAPAPIERLREALSVEDQFVVLHVDFRPGGAVQQHWVRAVQWWEDDVEVMDPWITGASQQSFLMARYALPSWDTPARAVFRMVIYRYSDVASEYPASSPSRRALVQEGLDTYRPYGD
jgi:hypothetical protein